MPKELIYVGVSGGVDSAVSLALVAKKYEPRAIFMRNWSKDLPGFQCPWKEDWHDAQSVALTLDTTIELWDFEKDYKDRVVDYLIAEYKAGRTPNPDIICNQEVKFKVFLEHAVESGANKIATGHYARIKEDRSGRKWLRAAKDETKDQSYFLSRISQGSLRRTIFPLGDLEKSEVRKIAKDLRLPVANKKDSVGICFVGEVGIVDFLKNFLELKPGAIIDIATKKEIGQHEGSELYTIGQRHGLNISSSEDLPYYITSKDVKENTIYVSSDISAKEAWTNTINLTDIHLPTIAPDELTSYSNTTLRIRHLGKLENIESTSPITNGNLTIKLKEKIKTPAPGQTGVIYTEDKLVLVSGFIS